MNHVKISDAVSNLHVDSHFPCYMLGTHNYGIMIYNPVTHSWIVHSDWYSTMTRVSVVRDNDMPEIKIIIKIVLFREMLNI